MNEFRQELEEAEQELRYWQEKTQSHRITIDCKELEHAAKKLGEARKRREIAAYLLTHSFSIPNN